MKKILVALVQSARYSPNQAGRALHTAWICMLVCIGVSAPVHASLVEIEVEGIWQLTDSDASVNPFGLVDGDTFVMKATYNDATFFDGADGVTAAIDPTVNAGTGFEIIIPHAGAAPQPLVFNHTDHIAGFAPTAEIEFDGTDAASDRGVFRNFDFRGEVTFGTDSFELDLYFDGFDPVSEFMNADLGFEIASAGYGVGHLSVLKHEALVPVPAAAWLFGSALGVLGWLRRRS